MRFFGLTPDRISPASNFPGEPASSWTFSVVYGGLSFGAVSVLAYSIWAFKLIPGAAAMYLGIAAIYIGCTGLALGRLVPGPGRSKRFALLFAVTFACYALLWCAFWFGLKGRHQADLWGSLFGLAVMTWLILRAFGVRNEFVTAFAVLFTLHTIGYYLGGELHSLVRGSTGQLLYGAGHGIGFGAGLGHILYRCQPGLVTRHAREIW